MAKYYSSTFGKISGKHGSAVAVIMKNGTTYLREYRKPSNPRTDKQQAHRAKFALTSKSLVPFNPIFKETIGITNGISIARSHAFKNAIAGEYPSLSIRYDKLMFSFGPVEKLHNTSFTSNEGVIDIRWDFKKMYNCNGNDNISVVIFNKDNNQSTHLKNVALRSDKKSRIDVNEAWGSSKLYLWAYATNGDKISDSTFVEEFGANNLGSNAGVQLHGDDNGKYNSVDTDRCVYTENESIEDKNSNSSTYYGINQAITSFIIMLYNLLGLLKQVVIESNIKPLKNSIDSITKYINNTYKYNINTLYKASVTWSRSINIGNEDCYLNGRKVIYPSKSKHLLAG